MKAIYKAQANEVTYRRIARAMGGWKWGYPRGTRTGIARYVRRGNRWVSMGHVCGGLTAANESYWRAACPSAFANPEGSLHMRHVR